MIKIIDSMPLQMLDALVLTDGLALRRKKYRGILICGMGGSGISGSIAQALFPDVDIVTNNDYEIPRRLDRTTLAVLISYSGNTEETLAAYARCARRGLDRVIISSGGRLFRKRASARIRVPEGIPPRGALGYLFTPIPVILHAAGLLKKDPAKELFGLACFLEQERPVITKTARRIAAKITGTLPIIYANSFRFAPVAKRWQGQFNENAKILAHVNTIPEMNHNEIVGLGYPAAIRRRSTVILLQDPRAHPRNARRARLLSRVVGKDMPPLLSITPRGRSALHNVFWGIWLGDYVSYYYAQNTGVDPLPVTRIERLKKLLSKN